ncbi:3-hydroxybutyrate dehydrogenase [Psychrobium sp. 1_MG-2023]|uniref:3-hydroxybutyrate dehydrogenase n=1 Tax=Psychrobium sp. 1_MG-2023 TaxID=3062624 RepID=UPI000C322281|nr:3-hydroxybutyrate dehydrogenase [Psychrobium sp. 1_MG-2023]MDP2561170.1 3-hydroxybutyrate dehydrogenase [Psychrobium sp. 1_MG-2023]PKF55143.1 D-beta-hydroxybutyrate dehydrogenase [Alteromonadales bacterium alter-6D02]
MAKVAIVTGGASGIGYAVAQSLIESDHVVVIADLNEEVGAKAAKELNCYFIQADLSQQQDNKRLVEQTVEQFGRVDILVNNAGFQHVCSVEEFPEQTWNTMISVMLTSPFLLTKYCWPYMKKQNWGRVVNIASVHGQVASPFKAAYIAAKHGLVGLTKTSALEGGECGITVNTICPAYVRTPLVDKQIADQAANHDIEPDEVITKIMLKNAAIKRMIDPEEIGQLVNYVVSDAARSFTGSNLTIDLGWTAQ